MAKVLILLLSVFILFNAKPIQAQNCQINTKHNYQAESNFSPDFIIRSGYSRNNDDPQEGSYETAVFDLELIGRKEETTGNYCLAFVFNSVLSSERENASAWSSQFFLRSYNGYILDQTTGKWNAVPSLSFPTASSLRFVRHNEENSSYLLFNKYPAIEGVKVKINKGTVGASLSSSISLGAFKPGTYIGRILLQRPVKRDNKGGNVFLGTDINQYLTVRHIIEWRLSIDEKGLVSPLEVISEKAGSDHIEYSGFKSLIRLINPPWNGKMVVVESGAKQVKYHRAGLMWRDVVLKEQNEQGKQQYRRFNLFSLMVNDTEKRNWNEEIGRLPAKGD